MEKSKENKEETGEAEQARASHRKSKHHGRRHRSHHYQPQNGPLLDLTQQDANEAQQNQQTQDSATTPRKSLHHRKSIHIHKKKKKMIPGSDSKASSQQTGRSDVTSNVITVTRPSASDNVSESKKALSNTPSSLSISTLMGPKKTASGTSLGSSAHRGSIMDSLRASTSTMIHPSTGDTDADDTEDEDARRRNRNTWSVEAFEPTKDRRFQMKFLEALTPFRWAMIALGRCPFIIATKKDGGPYLTLQWSSWQAIWCIIMSGINILLCVWVWISGLLFFGNLVTGSSETPLYWRYVRSHELILLKRNITTFIIFNVCIIHLFIVHFLVFYKKEFCIQYGNYWIECVELIRLHCVAGMHRFVYVKLFIFVIFVAVLITLFVLRIFHLCLGTGALVGTLLLRAFDPELIMWSKEEFQPVRIFGSFIFIYVFLVAKFSAIQFAVRCHMINQLVEVWNRRFRVCLHGNASEKRSMIRSSRAYLFKDHCVWVNILEGANTEMFLQIESFFVMVCASIVYELNHLVRALTGNEFDNNRALDGYVAIAFLLMDLYFFYNAGIEPGLVIETVTDAYDIVREKGVVTSKADQELWFMMSLQLSLMGSTDEAGMGFVGWEFVYYSKTFMLIAFGFAVSFFVMLWQYQQPIDQYIGNDPFCDRVNVKEFLDRILAPRILFPSSPTHLSACHDDYIAYYDTEL